MRALAPRAAQDRHPFSFIEQRGEARKQVGIRHDRRRTRQQRLGCRQRRRRCFLQCDVTRDHHNRDAALRHGLTDRDLEGARHLACVGDQLAVVAAFAEQVLRMGLLEIARPDLGRREVGRDRQHRHARAMAIEQAVDEMQVAGAAASGAHRKAAAEMRLGARREGSDLLVAHVEPFDLSLAADRVGQPVQAIADNAVDPLHTCCDQGLRELICDGLHESAPFMSTMLWQSGASLTCLAHGPERRSRPWRSCRPKGRRQVASRRYECGPGCAGPGAPT